MRTLWYAGEVPRFWFAETMTLQVAAGQAENSLWEQWKTSLGRTQVNWTHESALMIPVAAAMQRWLGPSLHLQLLVGAFWGVLAVVLAWVLGRRAHSPEFGLAFAALVAASPLQLAWSRLGGLQIGGTAHVLLGLWLGYLAGARAARCSRPSRAS
jgi:4-amino-4-deoxy-L-arabinose transferase-like glycosyltransferase